MAQESVQFSSISGHSRPQRRDLDPLTRRALTDMNGVSAPGLLVRPANARPRAECRLSRNSGPLGRWKIYHSGFRIGSKEAEESVAFREDVGSALCKDPL
jgi:hypothetical protein